MSSLHHRAKHVFLSVLDRPATDRPALLAEACANDEGLRREVESLLSFHDDQGEPQPEKDASGILFAPGEVFAGRYRMITKIGRGGMGVVWRADDLVLNTAVALKLIDSAGPEGRERIFNEVRLARQITHHAVCRVFDVGEADGRIFYSIELVRGEDLASLVRRVGRLPSEKVIDIASQLCAGMAAAHAQGVLHRDLKPANVLIDDEGRVRITDFGIAIPSTDAARHMLTGTPGYMAPEQRTMGTVLSERTDVYALGLVLYELLVGHHAFNRSEEATLPPPPSSLVPNVDPQLERMVMQSLSLDPRDRPSSVLELAAGLSVRETAGHRQRHRAAPWLAGSALAIAIGLLAVVSSSFVARRGGTLTERDTVVVADFENTTGEPIFDGTLKVALAVALEQSPFLKVFPDDQARDTLRLMGRSPDDRLTRGTAREIARREQLRALFAGSIAKFGRNYVISLEAVNAETGDVMAREQAEADGKEQVLTSLGATTSRLRQKLGESLASIQKFDVALPRATTSSLDALHAYALALSDGREVLRLEAIPHLVRAIELDPLFAMAHALLSGVYANTGQTALAPAFSQKAFELRDRVSEHERFFISLRYYRDARQDWDKTVELARLWTTTYPREPFAFNALGSALTRLGHFEQSVEPFRQSIRLDPNFVPAYSNLAGSLMALNQYEDAKAVLQEAKSRQLAYINIRRMAYLLAFVQGDSTTMARELESSVGGSETNAAYGWQGRSMAFSGQVTGAHEQFRRGIQLSLQGKFREVAAQLTVTDAENHATVGQCAEARSEASAGLELNRDNLTLERASRVLALCGASNEALSLSNELKQQFPNATLTIGASLPITAAAAALTREEPRRVLELLEAVRPYDRAPSSEFWPAHLRGQAYLQLKDGQAAAVEFQSIWNRRGELPNSMLYPLAHLGLARASMLTHDTQKARVGYKAFLALWKDADPNLPALQQARLEYSQLH